MDRFCGNIGRDYYWRIMLVWMGFFVIIFVIICEENKENMDKLGARDYFEKGDVG